MANKADFVGKTPQGWHLKKVLFDEAGNEFSYGELVKTSKQYQDEDCTFVDGKWIDADGKPLIQETGSETLPKTKEPEVKTSNDDVPMIAIPKSTLDGIMKQLAELDAQVKGNFGNVVKIVKGDSEVKKFGDGGSYSLDEGDFLDKPIRFVSIGKGWVISSYFIKGQEILAPYNKPLYFKPGFLEHQNTKDGKRPIPFCVFETQSKKESDFLKKSPWYNTKIFSEIDKAVKLDLDQSFKLEQATAHVMRMSEEALFAQANIMGISLHEGADKIRTHLITLKVQEMYSNEVDVKRANEERIKQSILFDSKEKQPA